MKNVLKHQFTIIDETAAETAAKAEQVKSEAANSKQQEATNQYALHFILMVFITESNAEHLRAVCRCMDIYHTTVTATATATATKASSV